MAWKRKLEKHTTQIKSEILMEDVVGWLERQPDAYLLAHADDGVIWGRLKNKQLSTSKDVIKAEYADVCPPLRTATLQQVRLFSEDWESLLWPTLEGWQHRQIIDGSGDKKLTTFDEHQLLWGDYSIKLENDFTLLEDGVQGLRHAVPLPVDFSQQAGRVALKVRHYLHEDSETGVNMIAHSRLVNIEVI